MYELTKLKVFLDITTYCNAGCPQCHRTNPNGLGKADWLPLIQWDLEAFKKAFPPYLLSSIYSNLQICGSWGEPAMNKDLYDIVKYIVDNSSVIVRINTNGSVRDELWWWKLGALAGKQLKVTFDVDGIDQEMHSLYRQNTDLEKILNNMSAIAETDAEVHTNTIIFKHNEPYLKEIEDLCKEHGATVCEFIESNRFEGKSSFEFINSKNEKQVLEKCTSGIGIKYDRKEN